jgi:hypothetical protein
MYAAYDDRAKVFTNVITKKPIDVLIQTTQNKIRGKVHIRLEDRFLDEINREKMFIPVTEAIFLDTEGNEIQRTNFLVVNRTQIIWMIPVEDEQGEEKR